MSHLTDSGPCLFPLTPLEGSGNSHLEDGKGDSFPALRLVVEGSQTKVDAFQKGWKVNLLSQDSSYQPALSEAHYRYLRNVCCIMEGQNRRATCL